MLSESLKRPTIQTRTQEARFDVVGLDYDFRNTPVEIIDLVKKEPAVRESLKNISDFDPKYTLPHVMRVASLTALVCHGLNKIPTERGEVPLRPEDRRLLETAALLHDAGKPYIDDPGLINKPEKLSGEERDVIRQHVKRGVDYLRSKEVPDEVLAIVAAHHALDGYGDTDSHNPLAIILEVVDKYDALHYERSYKVEIAHGDCIEALKETFKNEPAEVRELAERVIGVLENYKN